MNLPDSCHGKNRIIPDHHSTIYLNHAGTTWPKADGAARAVAELLHSDPAMWSDRFSQARQVVCNFFGVADRSRLLLTPSCTSALSIGIRDHHWERGDRILCSGLEHHALTRPLTQLEHHGISFTPVPPGNGMPLDLNQMESMLQRGGVRLVALTAACNVTGEILPFREVISLAHRYDALVLIDGAQVAGWLDLNLDALGADLFTFAGHKGPHAPWGIGGLYVRSGTVMNSPEATCEIGDHADSRCAPMPGFCDTGSVDLAALVGMSAALNWLCEDGQRNRLVRCCEIASQLARQLAQVPGITVLGRGKEEDCLPTVALDSKLLAPAELGAALRARGIMVSSGLQCAPLAHKTLGTGARGVVRISMGLSNTEQHVAEVVSAFQEILTW